MRRGGTVDLDRDPFEKENIYGERASVAQAMTKRLAEIVSGGGAADRLRATVSPEVQARLAALGYVASAVTPKRDRASRPDPKDCIGTYQRRLAAAPMNPLCGPGSRHNNTVPTWLDGLGVQRMYGTPTPLCNPTLPSGLW